MSFFESQELTIAFELAAWLNKNAETLSSPDIDWSNLSIKAAFYWEGERSEVTVEKDGLGTYQVCIEAR